MITNNLFWRREWPRGGGGGPTFRLLHALRAVQELKLLPGVDTNFYFDALERTQNLILNLFGLGGGWQNCPLRVFAKYLKNGFADLHKTLLLLRQLYR